MFNRLKNLINLKRHLKETYSILNCPLFLSIFDFNIIKFLSKRKWGKRLYYNKERLSFLFTGKVSIPILVYVVTTRCTLNCKYCNSFMPAFTKETHLAPVSFEQFKEDMDKLLKSVDKIHVFQFIGGEPFLAKDLPKMIEYAKSKKQIETIYVTTNATIKPSEKLLDSLKGVYVQLSDYRHIKGIKLYYDELKELFNKHKIKMCLYEEENDSTFYTLQEIYEKDEDKKTIENRSLWCLTRRCNHLCDGKLYLCPTQIHMDRNLKLDMYDNVVDIRSCNSNELTQKLIDFYSLPYYKVCRYCHFENVKRGQPRGEQTIIHISQPPEIAGGGGCLKD